MLARQQAAYTATTYGDNAATVVVAPATAVSIQSMYPRNSVDTRWCIDDASFSSVFFLTDVTCVSQNTYPNHAVPTVTDTQNQRITSAHVISQILVFLLCCTGGLRPSFGCRNNYRCLPYGHCNRCREWRRQYPQWSSSCCITLKV